MGVCVGSGGGWASGVRSRDGVAACSQPTTSRSTDTGGRRQVPLPGSSLPTGTTPTKTRRTLQFYYILKWETSAQDLAPGGKKGSYIQYG